MYVEKAGGTTYDEECINITPETAASLLDGAWRPQKNSVAVNAGNSDYYNNNFPAALISEKDKAMIGARFIGEAVDIGAVEFGQKVNWYVDAENGDDDNKGFPRSCPKKTLASAMESAYEGDVVYAAKGVYDEGDVEASGMATRVYVKEGVGLVAEGGPEVTMIKGSPHNAENMIGADAVRCVTLANSAWIQGFTITNGFTKTTGDSTSSYGGGIYAMASSAAIDCIITGNGCGYRGAGMYRGTAIRCLVRGAPLAGNYSVYRMGNLVNCVFVDSANCYGDSTASIVLNCLMAGGNTWGSKTLLCNSYVDSHGGRAVAGITNCVMRVSEAYIAETAYDPLTCKYGVDYGELGLDGDYRPDVDSVLVDFASRELYDALFPEAWIQFKDGDFLGGQRVFNGSMDVGAVECDWRARFSSELNGSGRAAVVYASENVTTNASGGIRIMGGDSVEIVYSPSTDGRCTFNASVEGDGGTVVAKLGDKVLLPDEHGVYCYAGNADGSRITVSYAGEGCAVLSGFKGAIRGFSFSVR